MDFSVFSANKSGYAKYVKQMGGDGAVFAGGLNFTQFCHVVKLAKIDAEEEIQDQIERAYKRLDFLEIGYGHPKFDDAFKFISAMVNLSDAIRNGEPAMLRIAKRILAEIGRAQEVDFIVNKVESRMPSE